MGSDRARGRGDAAHDLLLPQPALRGGEFGDHHPDQQREAECLVALVLAVFGFNPTPMTEPRLSP